MTFNSLKYLNKEEKKNWKPPSEEEMELIRKQLLKEHGNTWYIEAYTRMFDKSNLRRRYG